MSYTINLSYDKAFVDLMARLKEQYGEKLFDIDGIGKQLDINTFAKSFFSSETTSDVSVDPNANVEDTSVIAYNAEFHKAHSRLDSYYLLWKELRKDLSEDECKEIISANLKGDIYIHDFHGVSSGIPYCFNYSTLDILYNGLPMVSKITSLPAQHLLAFKSQVEQFVTIAANSTLGATGLADLLISCSYYMKNILKNKGDAHVKFASEEDCYEYFKQNMVSLIYTLNQPGRGNQSPFTNLSLYDRPFLESVVKGIVFPDGSIPDIELIEKLQILFMETMNKELERTPITFPVITACLSVEEGELRDKDFLYLLARENLKYGYINFYMGDTATLSSCCRLRSSTDNEFFNSFGAGSSKIGSLGVVTINFPRLAYLSKGKRDFEEKLKHYIRMTGKINNAKRRIVNKRINDGHAPLYSLDFMDLGKQYSTTGVNGLYECIHLLGEDLLTEDGQNYAIRIMQILNAEIDEMQREYKAPHNCEQVPGETSSIKLCRKDKHLGYDLGLDLYSNQFIPLTYPTDILNRIKIQGKLDQYFSGGSIMHINVEEEITDPQDIVDLISYCAKKGVVYTAICYLLNKCENDHMTVGHADKCTICNGEILGRYQRVVGFLTCVANWHKIRREQDFPHRYYYHDRDLTGMENV